MEVKDFEGAVKLQAALVEKISASRAVDPEGKNGEQFENVSISSFVNKFYFQVKRRR